MDVTFLTGLLGSVILVCGAAYPDHPTKKPLTSTKNWLFAIGALVMLIYAFLGYQAGGTIFFVILELFINFASVLMMANLPETTDTLLIVIGGIGFVLWSLFLFTSGSTAIFVIGLSCIAVGYTLQAGTARRETLLAAGSALVALFSFVTTNWIFLWLNVFFACFSSFYAWKLGMKQ